MILTRRCSKCETEKPLAEFTVRPECKACQAAYRAANKSRIAEVNRSWRRANKDHILANNKKWNAANPEKHRASIAKWHRDHPEKISEKGRRYRAAKPDIIKGYNRSRRARKLAAAGNHTATEIQILLVSQGHRCANPHCVVDLKKIKKHLDHKTPLIRGGSDGIENLQWLCQPCNSRKWTYTQDEWQQRESMKAAA